MSTVLASQNEDWGFFGSIRHHHEDQSEAWAAAFAAVAEATGCSAGAVREFLDSRDGRHFADEVVNQIVIGGYGIAGAVAAAVAVWKAYRVGRGTVREYRIAKGVDYLTGLVSFYQRGARA